MALKRGCIHVRIEPVAMIGTHPNGVRYIAGSAYSCRDCSAKWPYEDPEELPHWLYIRLEKMGTLPLPRLTPEIIRALTEANRKP